MIPKRSRRSRSMYNGWRKLLHQYFRGIALPSKFTDIPKTLKVKPRKGQLFDAKLNRRHRLNQISVLSRVIHRVVADGSSVAGNGLESPLLALPAQLRAKIFNYVFEPQIVHIMNAPDDADTAPTLRITVGSNNASRTFCNRAFPPDDLKPYSWPLRYHAPDGRRIMTCCCEHADEHCSHITFLESTCRQIYHETHLHAYKVNELSFENEEVMKAWILRRNWLRIRPRKSCGSTNIGSTAQRRTFMLRTANGACCMA